MIDNIIQIKIPCLFISPHFDDAVLSCGGLLMQLAGKTDVTVINVFTKAHSGPYTLSARKFLKDSGRFSNANDLFAAREKEDKAALSKVNAKIVNLGLAADLFRRTRKTSLLGRIIPEIDHIYPTYRWHVVKKIAARDPALDKLKCLLKQFKTRNMKIFVPYGIGNHVDHLITRKVCEELFAHTVKYSDFPYNVRLNYYGKASKNQKQFELDVNLNGKAQLINLYQTQIKGLFPNSKVPPHKEVYFY